MKKYLIFLVLFLSHFSVYAEGIKLTCIPNSPICANCSEFQTLFPVKKFSSNTGSLDIEADNSEILSDKYLLNGNVEVNSENLFLAADDVEVSPVNNSIIATGSVRFQDESFLITSNSLSASRDKDENLIATATNASYQDFGSGLGGANGYTESISKTPTTVLLENSTYSLCPVNKNDWLIDADKIELNLTKNRGVASNALVKFYGVPIFYLPKYSWVLSGRGSGFLTPNYSSYTDEATVEDAAGKKEKSYSVRIPYYFNLAPDRDLVIALNYMSSRRFIYEGKYRQLIAPKISPEHEDSIWSIEAKFLPEDKMTSLKRWLLNFSNEMDITNKTHLSAQYYRVSDAEYFKEIGRTDTNLKTLKSFLKLTYEDEENNLSAGILTEDVQVVNEGVPVYTRALEGSVSKTLNADTEMPISLSIVSTKFAHDTATKESGLRTHGDLGISRELNIDYPKITPKANVAITNYSLKNSPDISRTVFGSGLDIDFTINLPTSMFGHEANHRITPLISYNYRAKKVQGNIPIFDTEDKYTDIISFADLTSGERYTGLDRITNANDVTLSLESSYRSINALEDDGDLLNMRVAQSFYTDDEVVSDTVNTNYETRKSYSDIAASVDLAINNFIITTSTQFNPDTSKIIKRENSISYKPSSRKFATIQYSDDNVTRTGKIYAAYPLTKSTHFFGGLDRKITKATAAGVINSYTTGLAYENCCWAFRVAHFQEDKKQGDRSHNYSTGMELVLKGLGSTSTPLKGKIESNIVGYEAKLR